MNRRDFVKAVGVALADGSIPEGHAKTLTLKKPAVGAAAPAGAFNAGLPHGRAIDFTDCSEATVAVARDALLRDARGVLPSGTKFYVLDGGHHRVLTNEGAKEIDVLAWLYTPAPLTPPRLNQVIAEVTA